MRVLVDQKEILSTVELFHQENFTAFGLITGGGTYEYGPIKIHQAKKTLN